MTILAHRTDTLTRDALAVLQPGFLGTTAPDWLLRQVGEGLTAVGLFGRNITSPDQLAALTAQLRAVRDDVLVAIDEEGGDVTRLEVRDGSSFPGNLALGAVDDTELTRSVARELGRRLAECGVNLNWAPSADVNSNPDNPVIGVRSFGADTHLTARHTAAYVEGSSPSASPPAPSTSRATATPTSTRTTPCRGSTPTSPRSTGASSCPSRPPWPRAPRRS
jgi:beta-N-acetylhexosaminidase